MVRAVWVYGCSYRTKGADPRDRRRPDYCVSLLMRSTTLSYCSRDIAVLLSEAAIGHPHLSRGSGTTGERRLGLVPIFAYACPCP